MYFRIIPTPGIDFTRENSSTASGQSGTLTTAELFLYLDKGTDVNHADMPDDFNNETHPNSMSTSEKGYNRAGIYVNSKLFNYNGLAARNWSELVKELYNDEWNQEILDAISENLSR